MNDDKFFGSQNLSHLFRLVINVGLFIAGIVATNSLALPAGRVNLLWYSNIYHCQSFLELFIGPCLIHCIQRFSVFINQQIYQIDAKKGSVSKNTSFKPFANIGIYPILGLVCSPIVTLYILSDRLLNLALQLFTRAFLALTEDLNISDIKNQEV